MWVTTGNPLAAMLTDPDGRALIANFPLQRLSAFPGSPLTGPQVAELLEAARSAEATS